MWDVLWNRHRFDFQGTDKQEGYDESSDGPTGAKCIHHTTTLEAMVATAATGATGSSQVQMEARGRFHCRAAITASPSPASPGMDR